MPDLQLRDNQRQVDEGAFPHLFCSLGDDAGTVLPLSALVTLKLTIYYQNTPSTFKSINNWNAQNALNVNGCTFAATSGRFDWYGVAADSAIQSSDPGLTKETHYLRIDYTYNSTPGVRAGVYQDWFFILRKTSLQS